MSTIPAGLANLTKEQLVALVAQMQAQQASRVSFKVSDKGGLSVYGIGRFPTTLYLSQWEAILANADGMKAFIEANRAAFSAKPSKE